MFERVADIERLADRVRDLDVPLRRDALRELCVVRDLLTARLDLALADYEAAGHHEADGAVTLQSWVRHETGADSVTAVRTVRRARLLASCAPLADAALDGRLSAGQVEVIAATVPARHRALFAEHAADLVGVLAELDADQTVLAMHEWRKLADDLHPRPEPSEREDELRLVRTLDRRGDVRGSLGPDRMAELEAAVRLALVRDDERTLAERQADALGVVCRHFLDHQTGRAGGRHRPHINVVVDVEALDADERAGRYVDGKVDGMAVSPAELGALLCDSVLHRVLWSATSGILDYGRATRTVPVDLFNALVVRDHGCRFPGCDRPASWCDAHHLLEWEHGGPTSLDNLVLLCRRHHRKLHAGWHAELLPDAALEVTHPDGRAETTAAPGPVDHRRRHRRRRPSRAEPAAA